MLETDESRPDPVASSPSGSFTRTTGLLASLLWRLPPTAPAVKLRKLRGHHSATSQKSRNLQQGLWLSIYAAEAGKRPALRPTPLLAVWRNARPLKLDSAATALRLLLRTASTNMATLWQW